MPSEPYMKFRRRVLAALRRRWRREGVPPWEELFAAVRSVYRAEPPEEPFFAAVHEELDRLRALCPGIGAGDELAGAVLELYTASTDTGALSLRKRTGSFYTPPEVADGMAQQALRLWIARHLGCSEEALSAWLAGDDAALAAGTSRRIAAALLALRAVDPACGAGAFLLALLKQVERYLARALPREFPALAERFRKRLARRWLGVDLRHEALAVAAFRWQLAAPGTAVRLTEGDALFLDGLGGAFDLVLGNPPYVSFGLRNTGKLASARRRELLRRFPCAAQYKVSTYALFMELASQWSAPGGVQCLIVPDGFLAGRFQTGVRELLLTRNTLEKVILAERRIFDAALGRSVIYLARRGAPGGAGTFFRKVRSVAELAAPGGFAVAPGDYVRGARRRIRFYENAAQKTLVETMERGAEPLGDLLEFASGLIGKAGQKTLVSPVREGAFRHPGLTSGRLVHSCRVEAPDCFFDLDRSKIKSGLGKIDCTRPKLLLRQTGDRLIAALDERGLCVLNNVHCAVPKPGNRVSPEFLACLLGSELMNRYYRIVSLEEKRTLAQIDLDMVAELPVKVPPEGPDFWRMMYRRVGAGDPGAREELERVLAELYGVPLP